MRVFAGPNGSGKSTILKEVSKQVSTGIYINADDIEQQINLKKFINLGDYNLHSSDQQFKEYLTASTLVEKAQTENYAISLSLSDNIITTRDRSNSYEAALITDFLRMLILHQGASFAFETVMSHPGKLDTFKKAQKAGYKNYLYFVSTESVDINIERVAGRVTKGGHVVSIDKIKERYTRSMELVTQIIPYCHRCFIIDNSFEIEARVILEIIKGVDIKFYTTEIPEWVELYVLDKLGA